MAHPQMAQTTCSQCYGWYASEQELQIHMQAVHRRSVQEQSPSQRDGAQPGGREDQRDTSKED
jgi:hypothetical protein